MRARPRISVRASLSSGARRALLARRSRRLARPKPIARNRTSPAAKRGVQVSDPSRDVLPIPDRPYEGELPLDAKDPEATFPPIEPLRPPAGAPNVLVILLDDVGFAASSAFGGPCATPTAERLAANGLKYNRFHTTAP